MRLVIRGLKPSFSASLSTSYAASLSASASASASASLLALLIAAAGCGSSNPPDSPDAAVDAAIDAPPACYKVLLTGGSDVTAQGWTVIQQAPSTLTYADDYTRLETTTVANARTSGQLLITYADAVEVGKPFRIQLELMVESASRHNPLDAGAAILGAFTPTVGNSTDRAQMIYLDTAALGWADDTASFPAAIANGAYHTYVLSVDATGVASVTIDGTAALTRNNFLFNGRIAIGDQTNDPGIDGAMRIRKITRLCP
jgi:hypothetical protein